MEYDKTGWLYSWKSDHKLFTTRFWHHVAYFLPSTPYVHLTYTLCAPCMHPTCILCTLGEFWLAKGPHHNQWHFWYNNLIYIQILIFCPHHLLNKSTRSQNRSISWL